jgi:uncharacterized protein YydD (DUF2326 family)
MRNRKRWNLLSRTLFRKTQNLISEIDGRLLNTKLDKSEIANLTQAKITLRSKIKVKKALYQSQISVRLQEQIQLLYNDIDTFPETDLKKDYSVE